MAPFSLSIEPAISTLYHPPSYLKAIKPRRASHYQGQSWNFSNPISYLKVALSQRAISIRSHSHLAVIDRNHYPQLFNLKLELKLIKPSSNGLFKAGLMSADVFNWVPLLPGIVISKIILPIENTL